MVKSLMKEAILRSGLKRLYEAERKCNCYKNGVPRIMCGYKCWLDIPVKKNPAQVAITALDKSTHKKTKKVGKHEKITRQIVKRGYYINV